MKGAYRYTSRGIDPRANKIPAPEPQESADDHPDDAAASLKGKGETIRVDRRVARNAPCPCGSGKKSKRCCGG